MGGEVKDRGHPESPQHVPHQGAIGDVRDHQLAMQDGTAETRVQGIDDHRIATVLVQSTHDVAADVTGAAGNEHMAVHAGPRRARCRVGFRSGPHGFPHSREE